MQFNFLGGQSQRDNLSTALGQRNPVLEAQLDFSKSAFVTGVQGVGQTMRTAMQVGQQERESVLRNKTSIQEGILNRQKDQDLLSQRLAADKTAYERSLADQDKRASDARQARLDDAEALRQKGLDDQAEKERREKEEYARRLGLVTTDKTVAENKEYDKLDKSVTGELEGIKARFGGELESVTFDDDNQYDFNDDGTIRLDDNGQPIATGKRAKIQGHFDKIYNQAKGIANATERQAFIRQMTGQLSLTNIRGMYDSKFAEEERKRKLEDARAGATGRVPTPLGG